jgi:phosphoserine phosphatase
MIHFFDMDGTLLPGTSACTEIARHAGCLEELGRLERHFAAGELTTIEFARAISTLWNPGDVDLLDRAFADSPKIGGIGEVLDRIHGRGDLAHLITLSPRYFAERFRSLGFDEISGSELPLVRGAFVDPSLVLKPEDKATIAVRACTAWGRRLDTCVAYGDSSSDRHLFAAVGLAVGVNASRSVAELCDLCVETDDLVDVFVAAEERMDALGGSADRGGRA